MRPVHCEYFLQVSAAMPLTPAFNLRLQMSKSKHFLNEK